MNWFLLTRGVWLIFLEFTLVRFGWTFSVVPDFPAMQVIWAIGMAMIAFSGMVLPRTVVAAIASLL